MIDRYTKVVLTVIAVSLVALVCQNLSTTASAQNDSCGTAKNPCFVTASSKQPVWVLSVQR